MANKDSKKARQYEIVAADLLNRFCSDLGLSSVEGKQSVIGRVSGTDWEIDAKGIAEDGVGFLVVECKRHTTSNLPQAIVASLAYSIQDTGAEGGFIVSPLDLQSGAKKLLRQATSFMCDCVLIARRSNSRWDSLTSCLSVFTRTRIYLSVRA